jgi:hypothetical protein
MRKIAFFEPNVKGHRIEYIHHEVTRASTHLNKTFLFVVPQDFIITKTQFPWPKSDNISFVYLSDRESYECTHKNRLKRAWAISIVIRKYIKKYRVDIVFCNSIKDGMPFLPFMLPFNVMITGIIYDIYYWRIDIIPKANLIFNKFCFWLFAHMYNIKNIFLLNDVVFSQVINNKYNSSKFVYLPDPINNININKLKDLREQYNIPSDKIVYLQFPINERKHSLDILYTIDSMNVEDLEKRAFIFVGEIDRSIESDFMNKANSLSNKCQIIVEKGYVSYEKLFNLCYTSDVLLTLYDNYYMSSGIIGYAAFFKKYLISTGKGLLGNLVRTYNLGFCVEDFDKNSIRKALMNIPSVVNSKYASSHTVDNFTDVIFSFLN